MNHASLFSGIGGPDLAAEWIGWENIFHCEWNEFGKQILKYYWPNAISYDDITKTDFTIHRGAIDILTGGFPCQPYSVAGKQKGKEDERHLWPEMLRAVREIAPSYVVGENVGGLVSWNGGMVFDEVQAELENEGYEVFPVILPAASINAPHKRDRVFFIAYNNNRNRQKVRFQARRKKYVYQTSGRTDASFASCERCDNGSDNWKERQICNDENGNAKEDKPEGNGWECRTCKIGKAGNASNTESKGSGRLSKREAKESTINGKSGCNGNVTDSISFGQRRQSNGIGKARQPYQKSKVDDWQNFPTQSPICDGDDGLSARLDGITFPKWRKESIKAGGNAIVPQVMFQIFKAIDQHNKSQISEYAN